MRTKDIGLIEGDSGLGLKGCGDVIEAGDGGVLVIDIGPKSEGTRD